MAIVSIVPISVRKTLGSSLPALWRATIKVSQGGGDEIIDQPQDQREKGTAEHGACDQMTKLSGLLDENAEFQIGEAYSVGVRPPRSQ